MLSHLLLTSNLRRNPHPTYKNAREGVFVLYNTQMKTSIKREQVLARSREADRRFQESLKESDGMATYNPPEDEETVEEVAGEVVGDDLTVEEDEGGE